MQLVYKSKRDEIWAHYDDSAEVYELFRDPEGESYTGWTVDTIAEAKKAAQYIINEE